VLDSCIHHATVDARLIDTLPDDTRTLVLALYLVMRNIQIGAGLDGPQRDVPPLMLRSLLTNGEFSRAFIRTAASHFLAKLERCVRVGIAAGEIEGEQDEVVTSAWFAHHLAAAIVFFRLPGPVVDYPIGNDPERLLELSVRFVLRGLGLRKDIIDRHYQPAVFALLRGEPPRP
jgi:AcrR family transcriptional regulator